MIDAMLNVIKRCFPQQIDEWMPKFKKLTPSYGTKLVEDVDLLEKTYETTLSNIHKVIIKSRQFEWIISF